MQANISRCSIDDALSVPLASNTTALAYANTAGIHLCGLFVFFRSEFDLNECSIYLNNVEFVINQIKENSIVTLEINIRREKEQRRERQCIEKNGGRYLKKQIVLINL